MRGSLGLVVVIGCGNGTVAMPPAPLPMAAATTATSEPIEVVADGVLTWSERGAARTATLPGNALGVAAVDDSIVWLTDAGRLHVAPARGGTCWRVATAQDAVALAVADQRAYVLGRSSLHEIALDGSGMRRLGWVEHGRALAVGADAVFVAAGDRIVALPRAGGDVVTLATGAGEVVGLATDGAYVYWADHGIEPPHPLVRRFGRAQVARLGSIRRVSVAGGRSEYVARAEAYPTGVAISRGHVYWTTGRGEAVLRVPLDAVPGTHPERVLLGRGEQIAGDDAGVALLTFGGLLLDLALPGQPSRVRPPERSRRGARLALARDAIYVADPDDELEAPEFTLTRYARGASGITLIAARAP